MIKHEEIETWGDLLSILQQASPEQLAQPVQTCEGHPCDDHVHELQQGIIFGTINELEIRYARSVKDNRRNGDELVIYTDGNPFGEEGAAAYEVSFDENPEEEGELFRKQKPIFPKDHDESCDWTGPAQKLADEEEREKGKGTMGAVLKQRLKGFNESLQE